MTYEETLDFLMNRLPMYQRVGKKAFKKDLTNTIELLRVLDNPQDKFKSIHIAGTNGKGTVAHSLASILYEAGYKAGLYTSPHLKSYRERIRVNGDMVEESFVIDFVQQIEETIIRIEPSFFEITVAMAFKYFEYSKVDIAVVETGLGGRLDSTNVLNPILSVITSIGLDHQDMLGDTIELIATEKAGIIKENVPCVVGALPKEALSAIQLRARDVDAQVINHFENWSITPFDSSSYVIHNGKFGSNITLTPDIFGSYFIKNIPTILEATIQLNNQSFNISNEKTKAGLEKICSNTGLKGRWQILNTNPTTICDVAHNEDGLNEVMNQISKMEYENLHFVFGTVNDKNLDNVLPILNKDAFYYFCRANVPRAMNTDELTVQAGIHGLNGTAYSSVTEAIKSAESKAGIDDLIFIGGSTFVVAEIENL